MSYWYVATPYSKYDGGLEEAFQAACRVTGSLIAKGYPVYSPIAHTHPIAMYANMDPLDHGIWMAADEPLMKAAQGLIVVTMQGWKESTGVQIEIAYFKDAGKPIIYMDTDLSSWTVDAPHLYGSGHGGIPIDLGAIALNTKELENVHSETDHRGRNGVPVPNQ